MITAPADKPVMAYSALQEPGLREAYRLIAAHVYGAAGEFAYQAFDFINATFYGDELPEALILWDITEHGRSLGWCRSPKDGPPVIKLHPSTLGGHDHWRMDASGNLYRTGPWGLDNAQQLGACYAFDVLLHETMHASVEYRLGGWEDRPECNRGWTCHNNPLWVAECNRIAKLLGIEDADAQMSRCKRVPVEGEFTKDGKPKTKPAWVNEGNVELDHFPHAQPWRQGFYLANTLPFNLKTTRRFPFAEPRRICNGE